MYVCVYHERHITLHCNTCIILYIYVCVHAVARQQYLHYKTIQCHWGRGGEITNFSARERNDNILLRSFALIRSSHCCMCVCTNIQYIHIRAGTHAWCGHSFSPIYVCIKHSCVHVTSSTVDSGMRKKPWRENNYHERTRIVNN